MKTTMITTCLFFAVLLSSCEETMTNEQWLIRYKPQTLQEAESMGELQSQLITAKGKVASLESLDKFKILCAVGAVASIFAIALGAKSIGAAGLIACLGGFVLAYAGSEYAKYVGVVGLVMGVTAGVYATYIIIVAIKQIVKGNELAKNAGSILVADTIKTAQASVQSSATTKIVAKIKDAISEKLTPTK